MNPFSVVDFKVFESVFAVCLKIILNNQDGFA